MAGTAISETIPGIVGLGLERVDPAHSSAKQEHRSVLTIGTGRLGGCRDAGDSRRSPLKAPDQSSAAEMAGVVRRRYRRVRGQCASGDCPSLSRRRRGSRSRAGRSGRRCGDRCRPRKRRRLHRQRRQASLEAGKLRWNYHSQPRRVPSRAESRWRTIENCQTPRHAAVSATAREWPIPIVDI